MKKYSRSIIVLLSTVLVVAYNNCSSGFEMNTFDKLANNETASIDGTDTETDVDIDPVGTIDPVVIIDPIVIVDPIPTKPISPSYKDVFIENPDWSFSDDFESAKRPSFWISAHDATRAATCNSEARATSKVLKLDYRVESGDPGDSWSEYEFEIPVKAVEVEIRYKMYVPKNFAPATKNQKNLTLWSGRYGIVNSNISVTSESWPTSGGSTPSIVSGGNGNNFGHHMLTTNDLYLASHQGKWQEMVYYVKLATAAGRYGTLRIYRNKQYLTGTDHPDVRKPGSWAPDSNQIIRYAEGKNYVNQGYILGWVNGGFKVDTQFCVDDFEIKVKTK